MFRRSLTCPGVEFFREGKLLSQFFSEPAQVVFTHPSVIHPIAQRFVTDKLSRPYGLMPEWVLPLP